MTEAEQAKLVQLVMRELQKTALDTKAGRKLLVVFTGGLIGLADALEQIKQLARDTSFQVVMTDAAKRIITAEHLSVMGDVPVYEDKDIGKLIELVSEADYVLAPVLTLNTAAKLAVGIADNLAVSCILFALIMRKPVIAASNACDLNDGQHKSMGHDKANPVYQGIFQENLEKLRRIGITVVKADALCAAITGGAAVSSVRCDTCSGPFRDRVLSVGNLAQANGDAFCISRNTITTPSAQDKARELGVELHICAKK